MTKFIIISFLVLFSVGSCTQQQILQVDSQVEHIDSDLDGLPDYKDACPNEPGSPFNLGCPKQKKLSLEFDEKLSTDSDLDGVPDEDDECPNEYGSPFNQGCPIEE